MKKLLVLLCVIALLGALCVPAMAATSRVPVVVQVPEDWTTPYLYAWGDSEEAAWPGVPMTQIEDWFVAYMNASNYNIIINDGNGAQTPDIAVDQGMPLCVMFLDPSKQPDVGTDMPIDVPAEDKMPKPAADTIIAKVPDDWSTAFLYAWANDGAITNGGWPGVAMTKNSDGLWVGELTQGRYTNIIVTCSDAGPQTVDLMYGGGDAWVALQGDNGGKLDAAVVYSEPADWNNVVGEKPPVPTSDVWYVAGTMNTWNCADPAFQMDANGDGSFSFTMSLEAGDHQLKVTNGTWDVCFGDPNGPEGNYGFNLEAAADVTVNYDGNGGVTVEGPVGPFTGITPPPVGGSTWYVAGTMNDWNCADEAYKMTDNGDGTYSYIFAVTPGDYQLKVTNGTWDTCFGDPDGPEGNYAFNVTDETNCIVTFNGSAITHEFKAVIEPVTEPTEPVTEPSVDGGDQGTTGADVADKGEGNGNSSTMLIVSIIATVVVLAGGGVAVYFIMKKDKKEETAEAEQK